MSIKTKLMKCLIKTIVLVPIGFLYSLIFVILGTISLSTGIVMSFVFALLIMFWNVFDYEKYNDIALADFLESKHEMVLEQSNVKWNDLKESIEVSVNSIQFIKETDEVIKFHVKRKYLNSVLRVSREGRIFKLEIKSIPIAFIPDNAKNYNTLKRIQFELSKKYEGK